MHSLILCHLCVRSAQGVRWPIAADYDAARSEHGGLVDRLFHGTGTCVQILSGQFVEPIEGVLHLGHLDRVDAATLDASKSVVIRLGTKMRSCRRDVGERVVICHDIHKRAVSRADLVLVESFCITSLLLAWQAAPKDNRIMGIGVWA